MVDGMCINGYSIIRKIASGGVGTVYLAQNLNSNNLSALKLIPQRNASREKASLKEYNALTNKSGLMQILDSGNFKDYFYYVMPLADSLNNYKANDLRYVPKTLANIIEYKADSSSSWFSVEEIKTLILPVFEGLELLASQGLLHRDIKPENIVFVDGKATLCDFGLLNVDTRAISNIGTPFFLAPTWYIDSKGNPDLWGIAACFYMLITGNYPDSIGRYAYMYPTCYNGLDNFPLKEQYAHWHRCILRACSENAKNRFFSISDFKLVLFSTDFSISENYNKTKVSKFNIRKRTWILLLCCLSAVIAFVLIATYETPEEREDRENLKYLEDMDPIWTETYKNGNKVKNVPLTKEESIELYGFWVESPVNKEEYIELESYKDWLVHFAEEKENYLNNLKKIKDKDLSKEEKSNLNFSIFFAEKVYHFDCKPNIQLYIKHIDIKLHPLKYAF